MFRCIQCCAHSFKMNEMRVEKVSSFLSFFFSFFSFFLSLFPYFLLKLKRGHASSHKVSSLSLCSFFLFYRISQSKMFLCVEPQSLNHSYNLSLSLSFAFSNSHTHLQQVVNEMMPTHFFLFFFFFCFL